MPIVANKEASLHDRSIALMKFLSSVARKLGVGEHTYIVGGAVRNFVLGEKIKDLDVVVDSLALKGKDSAWFARELQKAIPVDTSLVTNTYGVAILTIKNAWDLGGYPMKGEIIEIANARKESYGGAEGKGYKPHMVEPATIQSDLLRREFTWNTLLWRLQDLASGPDRAEVLDFTGCGLRDLKNMEVRCPRDPDIVFADDPSRLLRVTKFTLKYGFKIPPDVEASIRRNVGKVRNIPPGHLSNMLIDLAYEGGHGKKALLEMDRLGILDVVRDIAKTNKVFQSALANWADSNASVPFLFDLLDLGMPTGRRLSFLDAPQRDQVRKTTVQLGADESERFLKVLEQPGKVIDMAGLIAALGLKGAEIRGLMQVARQALLDQPQIIGKPSEWESIVRTRMATGTHKTAAYQAIDWSIIQKDVDRFNDVHLKIKRLAGNSPEWLQTEVTPMYDTLDMLRMGADRGGKSIYPSDPLTDLRAWMKLLDRQDAADALSFRNVVAHWADGTIKAWADPQNHSEGKPMEWFVKNLVKAMDDYRDCINGILKKASPEKFTYAGLQIANAERIPDKILHSILPGVDYLLAMFKKRGVEVVLKDAIRVIEIRRRKPDETASGYWFNGFRQMTIMVETVEEKARSAGRFLKDWIDEVFLHEIGHYIHMDLLPREAREEWDKAWVSVEDAKKRSLRVNHDERVKFVDLLRKANWDFQAVGRRLKGLDRVKYLAWTFHPSPLSELHLTTVPGQVRLSDFGKMVQEFMRDPKAYITSEYPDYPEDRIDEEVVRRTKLRRTQLGVSDSCANYGSEVESKLLEKIKQQDTSVVDAINALGVTSDYAKTNEREDFAEAWVAFLAAPEKLTPQAKFRMQRTLSLAGLYGKPIMRLAVDPQKIAAMYLAGQAGNLTGVVEVPRHTHPVEVQPPRAKRKEFPFVGFIDFQGIQIDVEDKKGDVRKGKNEDGTEWTTKMQAHYGEVRQTEGVDSDKLDVYVGDNHDSSLVVVIHQHDPKTGKFDEDKCMLGFDSIEEAIGAYKAQYDKPGFYVEDDYLAMPIGQFWRWVHDEKNKGKKVRDATLRLTPNQREVLHALQYKTTARSLAFFMDWPEARVKQVLDQLHRHGLVSIDEEGWLVDFNLKIFDLLPDHERRHPSGGSHTAAVSDEYKRVDDLFGDLLHSLPRWGGVPNLTVVKDAASALYDVLHFEFESRVAESVFKSNLHRKVENLKKFLLGLTKVTTAEDMQALVRAWGTKAQTATDKLLEYRQLILGFIKATVTKVDDVRIIAGWRVLFMTSHAGDWDGQKMAQIEAILESAKRLIAQTGLAKLADVSVVAFPAGVLPPVIGSNALAAYQAKGDRVFLAAGRDVKAVTRSLVHELAHRYYHRVLGSVGQKEWERFFGANVGAPDVDRFIREWEAYAASTEPDSIERKYARYLASYLDAIRAKDPKTVMWLSLIADQLPINEPQDYAGYKRGTVPGLDQLKAKKDQVKVFLHPVTAYSGTSAGELFAEAFAHYITEGPRRLPELVRDTLREAVPQLRVASSHTAGLIEPPPVMHKAVMEWVKGAFAGHVLAEVERRLALLADRKGVFETALKDMQKQRAALDAKIKSIKPGQSVTFKVYRVKPGGTLGSGVFTIRSRKGTEGDWYAYRKPGGGDFTFLEPERAKDLGGYELLLEVGKDEVGFDKKFHGVFARRSASEFVPMVEAFLDKYIGWMEKDIQTGGIVSDRDTPVSTRVELELLRRECLKYTDRAKEYKTKAAIEVPVDLTGWKYLRSDSKAVEVALKAKDWDRISLEMGFNRGSREVIGRWTSRANRLEIDAPMIIGLTVDFVNYQISNLESTVNHEMAHVAQTLIGLIYEVGYAGLPAAKLTDPKYDPAGFNPETRSKHQIPHALRDIEFYPRLQSELHDFLEGVNEVGRAKLEDLFKGWVGIKDVPGVPVAETFQALKDRQPDKWFKAVKEFQKAIEKELGRPIAKGRSVLATSDVVHGLHPMTRHINDHAGESRYPLSNDVLDSIVQDTLGEICGFRVRLVDADLIRAHYDIDFTMGGNPARYGWVPDDEIWLESDLPPADWAYTLVHELVECYRMIHFGEDYGTAHDYASTVEVLMRQQKSTGIETREQVVSVARQWVDAALRKMIKSATANLPGDPAANLTPKDISQKSKLEDQYFKSTHLGSEEKAYVEDTRRRIVGNSDSEIDWVGFLNDWYLMKPIVRNMAYLRGLLKRYPEYGYSGEAYRVVEGQDPSTFWVKPPVSWTKSYRGVVTYNSMAPVDAEWEGGIIQGRLSDALDIGRIAKEMLREGATSYRIKGIAKVGEIVSLAPPSNVRVLKLIKGGKLIDYDHSMAKDAGTSEQLSESTHMGSAKRPWEITLLEYLHTTGLQRVESKPDRGFAEYLRERGVNPHQVANEYEHADYIGAMIFPQMLTRREKGRIKGLEGKVTLRKQLHKEYERDTGHVDVKSDLDLTRGSDLAFARANHKREIRKALGQGLPVPQEVLSLYPEISQEGRSACLSEQWGMPVAAKYKEKKTVETADGEDMTVYEYSDRQIANRDKEKAERIEKLRGNIDKLRDQVRKDLKAKDEKTRLVALAVGLLDLTFERVGNEQSAKDGHFGVTGWRAKHVSFKDGKATIRYVGKSGVDQEKVVEKADSVAALKAATEGKKDDDTILEGITAEDVNEYLKPFDVTAKDIRGYHANSEMQTRLKAIRGKGGKLPDDKKEREAKLKEEFKKALDETADAVGHEPSTLRTQYLSRGLEEEYMKDGTVTEKMVKEAACAPEIYDEQFRICADEKVKYPRTRHLPWSPGRSRDDLILTSTVQFEGKQVVVSEKLDGENCTIGQNYTHARSVNERPHPSRSWVKSFGSQIGHDIPDGWRLCGENLYAQHSIAYDQIPSYFMLFSVWDENNRCLSWQDTKDVAQMLGVHTVPVLYKGPWDEEKIKAVFDGNSKVGTGPAEGYVVRNAGSFHYNEFDKNIAKFVRASHVQTGPHWMDKPVVPNKLIKTANGEMAPEVVKMLSGFARGSYSPSPTDSTLPKALGAIGWSISTDFGWVPVTRPYMVETLLDKARLKMKPFRIHDPMNRPQDFWVGFNKGETEEEVKVQHAILLNFLKRNSYQVRAKHIGMDIEPVPDTNILGFGFPTSEWEFMATLVTMRSPQGGTFTEAQSPRIDNIPPKLLDWANKHGLQEDAKAVVREQDIRKTQVRKELRDDVGICPACFGDVVLKSNGRITRHGWSVQGNRRRGFMGGSWHTGPCFGAGYKPYEESPEGTKAYQEHLQTKDLPALQNYLKELEAGPDSLPGKKEPILKGTPEYAYQLKKRMDDAKDRVAYIGSLIKFLGEKVRGWKAPMPKTTKTASVVGDDSWKQDPVRWCPVCGSSYESQCRCSIGHFSCENGHNWIWCDVHKCHVVIDGDGHGIGIPHERDICRCQFGIPVKEPVPRQDAQSHQRLLNMYARKGETWKQVFKDLQPDHFCLTCPICGNSTKCKCPSRFHEPDALQAANETRIVMDAVCDKCMGEEPKAEFTQVGASDLEATYFGKEATSNHQVVSQSPFEVMYLPKYADLIPATLEGLKRVTDLYKRAGITFSGKIPVKIKGQGPSRRSFYIDDEGGYIQFIPHNLRDAASLATMVHEVAHYVHNHFLPSGFSNPAILQMWQDVRQMRTKKPHGSWEEQKVVVDQLDKQLNGLARRLVRPGVEFDHTDWGGKVSRCRVLGRSGPKDVKILRLDSQYGGRPDVIFDRIDSVARSFSEYIQLKRELDDEIQKLNRAAEESKRGEAEQYERNLLSEWFPTKYAQTNHKEWFADLVAVLVTKSSLLSDTVRTWLESVLKSSHVRVATKTRMEKEDDAAAKLVRKVPKKKPPRHDLHNDMIDLKDDPDVDVGDKGDDDDLSLNYKKVATAWLTDDSRPSAARVAFWSLIARKTDKNLTEGKEWWEGRKFPHTTEKGKHVKVQWKSLTPEERKTYQQQFDKQQGVEPEQEKAAPVDEEQGAPKGETTPETAHTEKNPWKDLAEKQKATGVTRQKQKETHLKQLKDDGMEQYTDALSDRLMDPELVWSGYYEWFKKHVKEQGAKETKTEKAPKEETKPNGVEQPATESVGESPKEEPQKEEPKKEEPKKEEPGKEEPKKGEPDKEEPQEDEPEDEESAFERQWVEASVADMADEMDEGKAKEAMASYQKLLKSYPGVKQSLEPLWNAYLKASGAVTSAGTARARATDKEKADDVLAQAQDRLKESIADIRTVQKSVAQEGTKASGRKPKPAVPKTTKAPPAASPEKGTPKAKRRVPEAYSGTSGYGKKFRTTKPTSADLDSYTETSAKTSNGSTIMGIGDNPEQDAQHFIETAKKAIEKGKKVVFLLGGTAFDGTPQRDVADSLAKEFGDAIKQDTWDDNGPYDMYGEKPKFQKSSPMVKSLIKHFGDPAVVEAGIYASMAKDLGDPSILSKAAAEVLKQEGIDPADPESIKTALTGKPSVISRVADAYAVARKESLIKKIQDIEDSGGVVLAAPSREDAYALKPVLEDKEFSTVKKDTGKGNKGKKDFKSMEWSPNENPVPTALQDIKPDSSNPNSLQEQVFQRYNKLSPTARSTMVRELADTLSRPEPNDPEQHKKWEQARHLHNGIVISQMASGDDPGSIHMPNGQTHVSPQVYLMAKALHRRGAAMNLLGAVEDIAGPEGMHTFATAIDEMDDTEMHEFMGGDKGPYSGVFDILGEVDRDTGMPTLRPEVQEALRNILKNIAVRDMTYGHAAISKSISDKTEKAKQHSSPEHLDEAQRIQYEIGNKVASAIHEVMTDFRAGIISQDELHKHLKSMDRMGLMHYRDMLYKSEGDATDNPALQLILDALDRDDSDLPAKARTVPPLAT